MRRRLFQLGTVTALILCVAACAVWWRSYSRTARLRERLTTGRWVRDLGHGPFREQYVYTFAPDGTYTSKLLTDHATPTLTGRWELTRGADGRNHLRLSGLQGQKDNNWLGRDSAVGLDEATGDLLVSTPPYAAEQRLRPER